MRRQVTILVYALAIISTGNWAYASDIVFEQIPVFPNRPGLSSPVNLDLSPGGARTADDFLLSETRTITEVHWWGACHIQAPPESCLAEGDDDFTFSFYGSAGNLPGNLLLETTGIMLAETEGASFAAKLDDSFAAMADTRYWLQIFNRATHEPWGWFNSASGNNMSAFARGADSGNWRDVPGRNVDTAFRLVIPEPGSFALATTVVAGLLLRVSKQR